MCDPVEDSPAAPKFVGMGLAWLIFWPIFQLLARRLIRNLVPYLLDKLRQELTTGLPANVSDSEISALIHNQHDNLKGAYHVRYLAD
jgi:hypothetical protein